MICKNCEHNFEGSFCNHCGQKSSTQRINSTFLLNELWNNIFQVDRGVLFTIKALFTNPGHSIREYLEGKRKQYTKPLAFLLILSTVYVITTYFTNESTYLREVFSGLSEGINQSDNKSMFTSKILSWLADNHFYATLILLPFFSLSSYLVFRKDKYNYFEHVVLNIYITGQQVLIFLFLIPLSYIPLKESYLLDSIPLILSFLFTLWTYIQFFRKKKLSLKIVLTFVTYILYTLVISSLAICIILFELENK